MYKIIFASLLFILSTYVGFGQKTIVGKILNKTTKEPISYANIGVVNSNVGTISNLDGTFSIFIPQKLAKDSLTFSSLGYTKQAMALNQLESKKEYTIFLNEKVTLLKTVVVTAKRLKEKLIKLGNSTFYNGNYEPDTMYAGRAVAFLIDKKSLTNGLKFPVAVKKASLYIFQNNFVTCKFRIRLNRYDSLTGKPGEDLVEKSMVVESSLKSGWLDFDLADLSFKATGPFFVTFEQLVDKTDRGDIALGYRDIIQKHPDWLLEDTVHIDGVKEITRRLIRGGLSLPGTFIGTTNTKAALATYSCFVRQTSLGAWVKVPMVITATVSVSRQASFATQEAEVSVVGKQR